MNIFDELNTVCPGLAGGMVAAAKTVSENPRAVLQEADFFSRQLVKAILAFMRVLKNHWMIIRLLTLIGL